jgi:hypothetical protein
MLHPAPHVQPGYPRPHAPSGSSHPRLFHPRPLAYLGLTTRPVTAPSVRSSAFQQDPSPARHVRPDQPGRTRYLDHPTRPVHLRPMCLTGPYLLPDLSPCPLCGPRSSTRHPIPPTICRLDHPTRPVHPRPTGTCLSGQVLQLDPSPRPLCGRRSSHKLPPLRFRGTACAQQLPACSVHRHSGVQYG